MVIPTKKEIGFFFIFAVFWTLIMIGPKILRQKHDWEIDLIWQGVGFLILAPVVLCYRKQKNVPIEDMA